ncbi:MAG: DNA topoisomerase I [Candidatus Tokpelaia sp. JSC189]|nr:MAG: DNA topoisomerase I [Candidatus Tokpelaia sp. JSC189]
MNVVVVESPTKAKTINKYLGSNYKVFASSGHVRDLSAKGGSVLPDDDFAMKWDIDNASEERLSKIAKAVKESDSLILATDPDREGEAISWHVLDVLQKKKILKGKKIKRVVFNAITKKAVLDAMLNPREIDTDLVDAYLARRALDYLVGFTLSPILWHKLPGARSAGRVQSVALRLICNRESEIERFVREDYWSVSVDLKTPRDNIFTARLISFEGRRFGKLDIKTEEEAQEISAMLERAVFRIQSIESKPIKRNPAPPFTTSTLQQAASSRLNFSASHTMEIAQRLYEGVDLGGETIGLITYMRTDGVQMTSEAIDSTRKAIARTFGNNYLPEKPRFHLTKAKNAQEAHEAIRPTDFSCTPDNVRRFLDSDQFRLYELIWKQTIASQMQPANIERTTIKIHAQNNGAIACLYATGSVIRFDGFLAVYIDTCKDGAIEDEENSRLPEMHVNEDLRQNKITVSKHTTEPLPRYSEATLIKKLEELGIGRPSTYTSILSTLRDRKYVSIEKRRLTPEPEGRVVTAFLENFFNRYVEYDFTADLEKKLDLISDGKLAWKDVLRDFWQHFSASVTDINHLRITNVLDMLNEVLAPIVFPARGDNSDPRLCPLCHIGKLSLKLSRYGAFVGCSNYPECKYIHQLGNNKEEQADKPTILGQNPQTGEDIIILTGRFGHYVQCGKNKEARRASIPKSWKIADIDLQKALALLSLPREIGIHSETGKVITSSIGRYGPYLNHNGQYANLESIDEVFTVGINRAIMLLGEKQKKGNRRSTSAAVTLAKLGEHPKGGKVSVQDGRYGPYVKWNKINATLPKYKDPTSVTLEEALALIKAKADKIGTTKTAAKKTATEKKAS